MGEILRADFLPKDEYKVELSTEDEGNPRLKVNLPADKMFVEVTDTTPPYAIVVVRADLEIQALGLLEKAKDMIKMHGAKSSIRGKLTQGLTRMGKIIGVGR